MTNVLALKIRRLHEGAVVPSPARPGDAGLDLVAISVRADREFNFLEYGTGISLEIPEGYVGLVFPRSSISKTSLMLSNAVGVIDSGYRGEILLRFAVFEGERRYKPGDKVGQLVILPVPKIIPFEVSELSETERGVGAFGSTGH